MQVNFGWGQDLRRRGGDGDRVVGTGWGWVRTAVPMQLSSSRLFYSVCLHFNLAGRGSRRLFYPVCLRFILQVEVQEGYFT